MRIQQIPATPRGSGGRRTLTVVALTGLVAALLPAAASAQSGDPREDLGTGWMDAETASANLELLAHLDRPEGFFHPDSFTDPAAIGSLSFANTDLAFDGDYAFVGNFRGFNIYDVSTPAQPELVSSVLCPGGQGDMTVHQGLLFMSVEQLSGRTDCGAQGAPGPVNPDRFRGIRIFDVSDPLHPVQVAAVQTCRGSHTQHAGDRPGRSGQCVRLQLLDSARAAGREAGRMHRHPGP
jgi:hypothetical protein